MYDNLTSLGTSVVLDAHNLTEGTYIDMDGKLFLVAKILDRSNIILRPILGRELVLYRITKFSKDHTAFLIILVCLALLLIVIEWSL